MQKHLTCRMRSEYSFRDLLYFICVCMYVCMCNIFIYIYKMNMRGAFKTFPSIVFSFCFLSHHLFTTLRIPISIKDNK